MDVKCNRFEASAKFKSDVRVAFGASHITRDSRFMLSRLRPLVLQATYYTSRLFPSILTNKILYFGLSLSDHKFHTKWCFFFFFAVSLIKHMAIKYYPCIQCKYSQILFGNTPLGPRSSVGKSKESP